MRSNFYILWGTLLFVALVVAACSPGSASTPELEVEAPTAAAEQPPPTTADQETGDAGETGETGETDPPATGPEGFREDVPIMEGARQLQIRGGGGNVTYEVDADIETAVEFYMEELARLGWEETNSPDAAVGSMATMLRENAEGDRITINMQANQLGGFVRISISVVDVN